MKIGETVYIIINTKTNEVKGVFSYLSKAEKVIESAPQSEKQFLTFVKTQYLG